MARRWWCDAVVYQPAAARPELAEPAGARGFRETLRFWLDRGVDGFRFDVAHGMIKHPELPDLGSAACWRSCGLRISRAR
ncbi:MAG: hypothetical protein IJH84_06105 [Saccharopolyspora sp.]|nr:hypothetical protein [Saccharopolyspora sp.]